MAQNAQPNKTEFTADQRKYLDWVAMPKSMRNPKTVDLFAKSIGVDRTSLWRWSKLPGFAEEVARSGRDYLKSELSEIFGALVKRALDGDVQAIKLALEVSGEYTPKQKVDLDIDVTKLSDDELRAIAESKG